MRKYIIYIGILALGLLLGWLIFNKPTNDNMEHTNNTLVENNEIWTCSMHPQIKRNEPGKCPICGMDLILAQNDGNELLEGQFKLSENAMALANIQTSIVSENNITNERIKLSGKIAENEKSNVTQVSYFAGRIEHLNINSTGEKVKKGQLLATIYSPELFAAQQELITASSLKEEQPKLYKSVRNKLKNWKISDKQINDIEKNKKAEENFPIYATVSGTVTLKLAEEGDYIKKGQPLLKINDLTTVWANFDVYENQIHMLNKGEKAIVYLPKNEGLKYTGKVDFIDPILNDETRTVSLRVVISNKDNVFKPGMFVTADIIANKNNQPESITIPASAVLWTGERSVVYLKTDQDKPIFEMQEVKLGDRIGDKYEVKEGLSAGNEVVTNGVFSVDAAAQLEGKKSMMNRDGGKSVTGHEHHLGQNGGNVNNNKELKNDKPLGIPHEFQKQFIVVYNNYIDLKTSLTKEDSIGASGYAVNLLSNLEKINMELLPNHDTHKKWMTLSMGIKSSALPISKMPNIAMQRNHFKTLSSYLIDAVKLLGVNEKVYVEYCPMADNNNGAYWLSKEQNIVNPYFGDAMLTCGEVKQVLD